MVGRLKGDYKGPAGEWDLFISLIRRFGWTEQDLWRSSPDLLDELLAYLNAEAIIKAGVGSLGKTQKEAKLLAWARAKNAANLRLLGQK